MCAYIRHPWHPELLSCMELTILFTGYYGVYFWIYEVYVTLLPKVFIVIPRLYIMVHSWIVYYTIANLIWHNDLTGFGLPKMR